MKARALGLMIFVAALALAAGHVHTYSGVNAGAYIDMPGGHWCGIEYRGVPGPFCDTT